MPAFKDMDIGDRDRREGHGVSHPEGRNQRARQSGDAAVQEPQGAAEKFHGLKDPDLRYRQRYVDMIVNPEVRETFRKRSRVINAVRDFLNARGFLEVDTPVLHTQEIGAAARTFKNPS